MLIHPGSILRVLRKRRRLTQQQAADAIGVTVATLKDWEQDKRRPKVEQEPIILAVLASSYEEYLLVWITEYLTQPGRNNNAGT